MSEGSIAACKQMVISHPSSNIFRRDVPLEAAIFFVGSVALGGEVGICASLFD